MLILQGSIFGGLSIHSSIHGAGKNRYHAIAGPRMAGCLEWRGVTATSDRMETSNARFLAFRCRKRVIHDLFERNSPEGARIGSVDGVTRLGSWPAPGATKRLFPVAPGPAKGCSGERQRIDSSYCSLFCGPMRATTCGRRRGGFWRQEFHGGSPVAGVGR